MLAVNGSISFSNGKNDYLTKKLLKVWSFMSKYKKIHENPAPFGKVGFRIYF